MSTTPLAAVVLAGGGPVGAAWEAAILAGLLSAGPPLREAEVVLGTSAGAVTGSWLTIQPDGLTGVAERMRTRALWHADNATAGRGDLSASRRLTNGRATSKTRPMSPISIEEAEATWRANLPDGPWAANLAVTAVDAETEHPRVWSVHDGLSVPLAVACSTAAPGVAPSVEVGDTTWVDGGVRSPTNADLILEVTGGRAAARDRSGQVLIFAPLASPRIRDEQIILEQRGYSVGVVRATRFYTSPVDLLDAEFIDVATQAGADQARELAPTVAGLLAR